MHFTAMHISIISILIITELVLGLQTVPKTQTDGRCPRGWRKQLLRYRRATEKRWPGSDCYDFTFQRSCFCPWTGPVQVSVRNGVIVNATAEDEGFAVAYTMQEIFDQIYDICFANCPKQGAVVCDASYAREGYVTSLYINRYYQMLDEEISYTISNFTFCDV